MARYSKNISTFVQKQRHQLTNNGSIIERDWTTLGERHVIEPGKKRIYSDTGFLFTENTKPGLKKRHNTEDWSDSYTLDTLSYNVNSDVNIVKLPESYNITDYAYYGSAVEMVRASLENIVKWFPGKAWTNNGSINKLDNNNSYILSDIISDGHHNYILKFNIENEQNNYQIFEINNPFDFDFFRSGQTFGEFDNPLRNIPFSWGSYYINGCKILSYVPWIKTYNPCEEDYNVIYDIYVEYEVAASVSKYDEYYNDYNVIEDCIELLDNEDENNDCVVFKESDIKRKTGHIYGLKYGNSVIWCTDIKDFTLVPMPNIIKKYFDELDGFERVLLTKKSYPIYSPLLKTPVPKSRNNIGYVFNYIRYKFPSFGYCIICNDLVYNEYVTQLYNLANIIDENYADNIWRKMTHESIIQFDWTFKREESDEEIEENILGGTQLKNILRIYGRFFDDIKRYIDGIKIAGKITLDGIGNLPEAMLSDKAELSGWEIYSTKLNNDDNIQLTKDFFDTFVTKKLNRWYQVDTGNDGLDFMCDSQPKWYPTISPESVYQNNIDNMFMRYLATQSAEIFRHKGTLHGIEMLYALFGFGDDDFELSERYYSTTPIKSDSELTFYVPIDKDSIDTLEFEDVSGDDIYTLLEYVHANPINENSIEKIYINGEYYILQKDTFKNVCKFVNENKRFVKNYPNDEFSGVPIKEITLGNENYIVPYFTQDKIYDGNVQFETNGGWGKQSSGLIEADVDIKHSYMETLPYTPILQNCSSLLEVNQYEINEKRLYYVMDITDITDFTEENYSNIGHYFKILDNRNPQLFSSWSNIPGQIFESEYEYEEYCNDIDSNTQLPLRPLFYGITYDDYILSKYYDSIVIDNKGNNPHSGEAKYDLGDNYKQYLTAPFKYSEIKDGFEYDYIRLMAEMIRFYIKVYDSDKIIINNDLEKEYFLPSKLLIIKNNIYSDKFDEYFKNVIIKYLTQVIPSTTILVFM